MLQLVDTDPQQAQLKQNPLLMQLLEPVELTPAQLSIALGRPVLGITKAFQEKFEVNIQLPTKVLAKQKQWKRNPHKVKSIIIILLIKKKKK